MTFAHRNLKLPKVWDETNREIDGVMGGSYADRRYAIGEALVKCIIPTLRESIEQTARQVSEQFEQTPASRDIIAELLLTHLASFLAARAIDRENVARLHWLTEEHVREALTFPRATRIE